jgi:ribosomal protein S18 acetylase RimI-like enzyme
MHTVDIDAVQKTVEHFFLCEDAVKIRELFFSDTKTREALGEPPTIESIIAGIANTRAKEKGKLRRAQRRAFGVRVHDIRQNIIGYIAYTIAQNARLSAFDRTHVWGNRAPQRENGVYLKHIVIHREVRRLGAATKLISVLKKIAESEMMPIYADMRSDNAPMRACAAKTGGLPSIFWHTPNHVLMVRYRW